MSEYFHVENRTLPEANEEIQKLLFRAQADVDEVTGEPDPVVQSIKLRASEAERPSRHQPVPHRYAQMREDVHHAGHLPLGLGAGLAERLDEPLAIAVVLENGFTAVATIHDMVNRARTLHSKFAGHEK